MDEDIIAELWGSDPYILDDLIAEHGAWACPEPEWELDDFYGTGWNHEWDGPIEDPHPWMAHPNSLPKNWACVLATEWTKDFNRSTGRIDWDERISWRGITHSGITDFTAGDRDNRGPAGRTK